jgi:hypothetical protein
LINHAYDAYQFRNGPSNACITVTLTAPLADFFSAAYLNSFTTTDLCSNYLADAGNSTMSFPSPSYSFNVPPNTNFVVIVNAVNSAGSGPYTLEVHGSDCAPSLNITQVASNKVALDWTTAAAGFLLESSNNLPPSPLALWPSVPTVPVVVNGRFQVTNIITTDSQFFRLRKPLP